MDEYEYAWLHSIWSTVIVIMITATLVGQPIVNALTYVLDTLLSP